MVGRVRRGSGKAHRTPGDFSSVKWLLGVSSGFSTRFQLSFNMSCYSNALLLLEE